MKIWDRFMINSIRWEGYRYIMPDEFMTSIELGMCQVHGNIPQTKYTRRIEWGFGWYNKDSCTEAHFSRRFWAHFHRTQQEGGTKLHGQIYWRQYDGLSIKTWGEPT